jgi:hypothetical protein
MQRLYLLKWNLQSIHVYTLEFMIINLLIESQVEIYVSLLYLHMHVMLQRKIMIV